MKRFLKAILWRVLPVLARGLTLLGFLVGVLFLLYAGTYVGFNLNLGGLAVAMPFGILGALMVYGSWETSNQIL